MRVFVSVPVRGRSDAEVAAEKQAVLERVRKAYPDELAELIDTDISEKAPMDGDRAGVWYLGKSLELLATADVAYFCADWVCARGCRVERQVCNEYGIPILFRMLEWGCPDLSAPRTSDDWISVKKGVPELPGAYLCRCNRWGDSVTQILTYDSDRAEWRKQYRVEDSPRRWI